MRGEGGERKLELAIFEDVVAVVAVRAVDYGTTTRRAGAVGR